MCICQLRFLKMPDALMFTALNSVIMRTCYSCSSSKKRCRCDGTDDDCHKNPKSQKMSALAEEESSEDEVSDDESEEEKGWLSVKKMTPLAVCPACDKVLASVRGLFGHYGVKHRTTIDQETIKFCCPFCSDDDDDAEEEDREIFDTMDSLESHVTKSHPGCELDDTGSSSGKKRSSQQPTASNETSERRKSSRKQEISDARSALTKEDGKENPPIDELAKEISMRGSARRGAESGGAESGGDVNGDTESESGGDVQNVSIYDVEYRERMKEQIKENTIEAVNKAARSSLLAGAMEIADDGIKKHEEEVDEMMGNNEVRKLFSQYTEQNASIAAYKKRAKEDKRIALMKPHYDLSIKLIQECKDTQKDIITQLKEKDEELREKYNNWWKEMLKSCRITSKYGKLDEAHDYWNGYIDKDHLVQILMAELYVRAGGM